MIAITHQTFGITFGLVTILILQILNIQPHGLLETIFFFGLLLLGSLLPDLDTPNSKLGRKLWPIAFMISIFVKHRTATHSLLFFVIVTLLTGIVIFVLKLPWFFTLSIGLGILSHIVGDWFTKSGVPFLYPFNRSRYKAPITFRTGSSNEAGLCVILFVLNVGLFMIFI